MSQQKALVSSEVHNMDRSMRKVSMVWKMHEKINYSPAQNVHNLTPPPKKKHPETKTKKQVPSLGP